MNSSYLITFANIFDRKYFEDNIEQFFYYFNNKLSLKELILSHSSTFIEFRDRPNYFSYYALLEKFPNTKITKKLVKEKKTIYIKIKKERN